MIAEKSIPRPLQIYRNYRLILSCWLSITIVISAFWYDRCLSSKRSRWWCGADRLKTRCNIRVRSEPSVPKDFPDVQIFTFCELATATNSFRPECFLGEGGFGRVYKGRLSSGQVVAVKQLDRNGLQGNREFLVEVLILSLLHDPNLVNLICYCAEGEQRLLVCEFMTLGSLEDHLFDLPLDKEPLDWNTRMKIAAGAAKGWSISTIRQTQQ